MYCIYFDISVLTQSTNPIICIFYEPPFSLGYLTCLRIYDRMRQENLQMKIMPVTSVLKELCPTVTRARKGYQTQLTNEEIVSLDNDRSKILMEL